MKSTEEPIVVEETYNASREMVWKALTEPGRMRQWYFGSIRDFVPEVGFETVVDVTSGERNFPHLWNVMEVEPGEKIVYGWKYRGYDGDSYVTFELGSEGEGSRLRLTHTVTEDFADAIPEFRRESCEGGWTYFLKESLKGYLEKHA